MDKFGIFNILSSLLQSFQNKKETNENAFSFSPKEKAENKSEPLSELLNIFKNQTGKKEENPLPEQQANIDKNSQNNVGANSLKTRLLQTASSHDEFVKRVTLSNKK